MLGRGKDVSTPRLSICIPTLNRHAYIGAAIDSILDQATEEVEIIVVDAGSSDDTERVVRQRQKSNPRLLYARSAQLTAGAEGGAGTSLAGLRGFEVDCDWAVRLSHGEYCWLLPDDDLLHPDAIQRVVAELDKGYSLILVNAEVRTHDLLATLQSARLDIATDQMYLPHQMASLLADTGTYMSYIGGVVLRKDIWTSRDLGPYIGSAFPHVGIIFQASLPTPALVIAQPLVTIRYGNAQWYGKAFEIWMFKWPGIVWSFSHLPDAAKRRVVPREPWKRAKTLLRYRAAGAYGLDEYQRWIRNSPCSPWVKWMARSIVLLPGQAVNSAARFYYSRLHSGPKLELADMELSRYSPVRRPRGGRETSPLPGDEGKDNPC